MHFVIKFDEADVHLFAGEAYAVSLDETHGLEAFEWPENVTNFFRYMLFLPVFLVGFSIFKARLLFGPFCSPRIR